MTLEVANKLIICAFIALTIAIGTICWALLVFVRSQRRQLRRSRNTLTSPTNANATTSTRQTEQDDTNNKKFDDQAVAINMHRLIGEVVERVIVDADSDDIKAEGTISRIVQFGNEVVTLVESNDKAVSNDTDFQAVNATTTTTTTDTTCVICLCDSLHGDSVYRNNPDSTCHHMFHETCIRKWIRRQQEQQQSTTASTIRPVCPCCRYPIQLPN